MHEHERIIKIRNPDMKVAIAFDYMRVKIGEIAELEKFNDALNELLVKEKDEDTAAAEGDGGVINANGKKTSGDEAGGSSKKKQKQKPREQGREGGTPGKANFKPNK
jgi:ribonuclease Z